MLTTYKLAIQIAIGIALLLGAYLIGVKTTPFAIEVNKGGVKGYHSVFYVKANSPYQKIEDLKGKSIALVDPNSTSGNNVPRYAMDKMGIKPDEFFGKVVYSGSHVNAVMALNQGTVDVAANWWNNENDSEMTRMADKGMVKVLAATAPSKSAATKSLPLISTSLPGFDYTTWYAMYAPLATPKPIVDSINAALTKALKNTAMVAKIEAAGTELQPGSPEDVMAWTQRDTDKWARVIRDAKISVE